MLGATRRIAECKRPKHVDEWLALDLLRNFIVADWVLKTASLRKICSPVREKFFLGVVASARSRCGKKRVVKQFPRCKDNSQFSSNRRLRKNSFSQKHLPSYPSEAMRPLWQRDLRWVGVCATRTHRGTHRCTHHFTHVLTHSGIHPRVCANLF